jgi:hypothetical protein
MKDSGGVLGETGVASPRVPAIAGTNLPSPAEVVGWASPGVPRGMSPLKEVIEESKWNTKNLPARTVVDVFSAACAGGLVAPLITTIDK